MVLHDPRYADLDGEVDATTSNFLYPLDDGVGVVAELGHDVRRERCLLLHRFGQDPIREEVVALRIAGDPHLFERVLDVGQRGQEFVCRVELPRRFLTVATRNEDVRDASLGETASDLGQVVLVPHVPRGDVRTHVEPARSGHLGLLDRRVETELRRRGDGDGRPFRQVF